MDQLLVSYKGQCWLEALHHFTATKRLLADAPCGATIVSALRVKERWGLYSCSVRDAQQLWDLQRLSFTAVHVLCLYPEAECVTEGKLWDFDTATKKEDLLDLVGALLDGDCGPVASALDVVAQFKQI